MQTLALSPHSQKDLDLSVQSQLLYHVANGYCKTACEIVSKGKKTGVNGPICSTTVPLMCICDAGAEVSGNDHTLTPGDPTGPHMPMAC